MTAQSAFTPGATITFAGITTTSAQALPKPVSGAQIRVAALAANTTVAFMKFGDSTVTATTADTPVLPGSVELFTAPTGATHVAFVSASAATVYVTSGYGA